MMARRLSIAALMLLAMTSAEIRQGDHVVLTLNDGSQEKGLVLTIFTSGGRPGVLLSDEGEIIAVPMDAIVHVEKEPKRQ
jgi:hypothetical protein